MRRCPRRFLGCRCPRAGAARGVCSRCRLPAPGRGILLLHILGERGSRLFHRTDESAAQGGAAQETVQSPREWRWRPHLVPRSTREEGRQGLRTRREVGGRVETAAGQESMAAQGTGVLLCPHSRQRSKMGRGEERRAGREKGGGYEEGGADGAELRAGPRPPPPASSDSHHLPGCHWRCPGRR